MAPETITPQLVLFIITILGAAGAVWFRIESKVDKAKAESTKTAVDATTKAHDVAKDLAAHKLHVAEVYITKEGMRTVRDEIITAVSSVKDDVGRISDRMDRMYESKSASSQQ